MHLWSYIWKVWLFLHLAWTKNCGIAMTTYAKNHRASIENPEEFWAQAAEGIDWDKRWDRVLDNPASLTYQWFAGGRLNTCYNAVDRHVERGRGDQAAIIYDSAVTDTKRTISYSELLADVSHFAGVLAANGVARGKFGRVHDRREALLRKARWHGRVDRQP